MMLPGSELLAAHPAIVFAGPAIIFAGYLIFGISGFGASLITVPVLSYYLSLKTALPICVLLDLTSAMVLGTRLRGGVEKREILLLVPFSLIGAVTGATLLLHLPRQQVTRQIQRNRPLSRRQRRAKGFADHLRNARRTRHGPGLLRDRLEQRLLIDFLKSVAIDVRRRQRAGQADDR
jgi:hypothetical protein